MYSKRNVRNILNPVINCTSHRCSKSVTIPQYLTQNYVTKGNLQKEKRRYSLITIPKHTYTYVKIFKKHNAV